MVGSNNSIHQNSAGTGTNGAQGGGVRLQNCIMRIASRSPIFGSVQSNTASGPGGGISITGERARLTLFNLLPGEPTSIALNTAGGVGGGIDIGSSAKVFGYDIIIDGNVSRSGGGGVATFDNDDEPSSELVLQGNLGGAPAGAVNCVAALDCNRVSNNLARSMAGVDQPGAALRINGVGGGFGNVGLSIARLSGTRLNGNNGRNLVDAVDERSEAYIDGALIDGNNASAELMHSPADGFLRLSGTTIAGNTIADAVIRTSSLRTVMQRSVVWQPGRPLYSLVSGSLSPNAVIYVLSNSLANAPPNTTNRIVNQFEIAFVDAAAGDYRPAAGSLAIDYAAASAVLEYTRDRFPRNVGIPQAPDQFGTQDAGAFEKQSAEGFNSTPSISVAGTLTMLEDGGEFFLQGFSLADPDGDIVGALYVTAPPGTGFIDGLYFAGVSATQLLPNRIVIEGPLSRITNDTATLAGVTRFFPAANVFGAVPIALELNDQGNTGIGTPLSAQATLTVDVLPVNDAPTLAIADIVRTAGMSGAQEQGLVPLSTFVPGPSNESSQTIERFVLAGFSDPGNILAAPPTLTPAGQLVFNLNGAVGVVLLDVYVEDSGGTDNGGQDRSAAARFSLRVVGEQLFSNGFE
jgi:hypothetical protein